MVLIFEFWLQEATNNIVRTLREYKPLRLLLNLLLYHYNRSDPTYKSQRIKLLDVIAACNQLNVKAINFFKLPKIA